jgi:hypothetical protein
MPVRTRLVRKSQRSLTANWTLLRRSGMVRGFA